MRRVLSAVNALALLAGLSFTQGANDTREETYFQPPETVSATNVRYPIRSIAFGTVVLEARISETGAFEDVKVLRDIASLTPEAIRAVKNWAFKPARLDGKVVRSRMTVAVTFNPAVLNPADIPLPPLAQPANQPKDQLQFEPPEVVSAAFPNYPARSVAFGTVVLEVTIGETGEVEDVKVVRDIASLTPEAIRALKKWKFKPARSGSKSVRAEMALAFVFRLPLVCRLK